MPENSKRQQAGSPETYPGGETSQIASSRGIAPVPGGPVINVPGAPAMVPPAMTIISPELSETLGDIIAGAIKSGFDRFSIYTQSKPFDNYDVIMALAPIAPAQPILLDALGDAIRGRRAYVIQNTDAANNLWVNKTNTVAVNNGFIVPPNGGTYEVSLHERNHHWAIAAVAQIVVATIWYN